jgi:autotransporter-associated beta strand protein
MKGVEMQSLRKFQKLSALVAVAMIGGLAVPYSLLAATDTYSGTGGVWNSGVSGNTVWNGSFFTNGDSAQFSLATSNSAITLGDNITVANILSNGATTPATMLITGSAGKTLTFGTGVAGSGNITDAAGTSVSYSGNLTYASSDTTGGTFFQLAPGSGTPATPTIWNMASGKTLSINPKASGDITDLGGNTINLTGPGTVQFAAGVVSSIQNGTFNVNAGVLVFAGGSSSSPTLQNSVTVNVATSAILRLTSNTSGTNYHYNELVNLNGGTLAQISGPVIQSGAATVGSNGGTFLTTGNGSLAIPGGIGGSGPITFTVAGGTNSILLTGSNSFTGNMTVTANTLSIAGTGSLGGGSYAGAIAVNNANAMFSYSSSTNQTLSGPISGAGGLRMAGTGSVLTLTGSNTYAGATAVASGVLVVANTAALPAYPFSNVSVAGGAVLGVQANTNGTSGWNTAQIDTLRGAVTFTAATSGLGIDTTQGSFSYASTITNPQSMALYVMGTNTLTLATTNSYTGGTTVSAGTLQIGDGVNIGNIGPGNLTLAAGTTLDVNLPGVQTVGTSAGYTQFTFNNNSTIKSETGNTTLLSVNTTTSGGSNYMLFNGTVNLAANNGSTLKLQTIGNPGTSSGDLPGMNISGGAVINSTGNVILDASAPTDSTFMRSFDLSGTAATFNANSGTLTINTSGQAGASGAVGFFVKTAGTVLTTNGNVIFNNNAPSRGNGWSANFGTINVNSGTLTANGNTGNGMNISSSTLNIAAGAMLAFAGSDTQTMAGTTWTLGATAGNLSVANSIVMSGAFTLAGGVPGSVSSFSNAISGSGTINKSDLGLVVLSGVNTYAGNTTISNGTLQLGGPAALPSNGSVTANGGVFDLNANNATVGQLNGVAGVITDNSAGAGITTLSATSGNFNGTLRNGQSKIVALSVPGPGALTLGSSNSYAGATTVNNGGALYVNGTHTGGGDYNIGSLGSGGTLGGVGAISGTNTVNLFGGATIAPGALAANANNIGTLTLPSLSTSGSGTFNFVLSNSPTSGNDLIQVNGNLTLNGQSIVSIYKTSVLSNGNYPLFKYTGSLTYSGSATALAYAPSGLLSARQHATFDYGTPGVVSMDIVGNAANLTWVGGTTGAGTNVWDQDDSANTVWNNGTGSDYFATSDKVTFNGTAIEPNTTVNLTGTLTPGSVTVTGSNNYTFTGSGMIGGSTQLVMAGPGSLTIASGSNSYAGGTSISGGTLNANVANALGSGTLAVSGGVLNANYAQSPSSVTISSGTLNANAINALGNGAVNLNSGVLNANFAQSPSSVTLTSGLLNIGDAGALGSGNLTISGGSLDNTSAAPLTLAGSNTQNWNGNFTFVGSSPLDLGSGSVTLGLSPTVSVGSAGTLTVDGAIGDGGNHYALTMAGPGALVLTHSNTYGGGTTLAGGMLVVSNSRALGSGSLTINGGTLDSITAGIALNGNPQQAWNGDFTFNGSQSLSMGSGAVTLGSSRTVTINANALTVGPVGDGGNGYSLTLAGSGLLSLTGTSTYTGATTINGGTLQIGNTGVLGGGSYNAAITDNGMLYVNSTANQTFGGAITGAGSLVKTSNGVLTLTASNNYAGGTTVNGPADSTALVIANNNALGSGTLTIIGGNTFAGGVSVNPGITLPNPIVLQPNGNRATMALGASSTLTGPIVVDGSVSSNIAFFITSPGSANAATVAGNITHSGLNANPLVFRGQGSYGYVTGNIQYDTGTVEIFDNSIWQLSGSANNYGTFTISNAGARLYVGATNTLAPAGLINDNGSNSGTLVLNDLAGAVAYNQTIAGLNQSVKVTATTGSPVLTMSNDTTNYGTSGNITGPVALVKAGAYTQILSGTSSNYTGGTTILDGVLQLGSSSALGTGGLVLNSGTLDLAGFSAKVSSFSGAAGMITNTGINNSVLTVNQSGATTFGGTIVDGPNAPFVTVGLRLTGGSLTLSGTSTYTGGTTVNNGTLIATNSQAIPDNSNLYVGDPSLLLQLPAAIVPTAAVPSAAPAVSAVPEPGTVALIAAAIAGLAACRRMRRR